MIEVNESRWISQLKQLNEKKCTVDIYFLLLAQEMSGNVSSCPQMYRSTPQYSQSPGMETKKRKEKKETWINPLYLLYLLVYRPLVNESITSASD